MVRLHRENDKITLKPVSAELFRPPAWELTSPWTFYEHTIHRDRQHANTPRYFALEADHLSENPEENKKCTAASHRFLAQFMTLSAVVDTGNKSFTAGLVECDRIEKGSGWLKQFNTLCEGLGFDPQMRGGKLQCARIAGVVRKDTGKRQRLLWFNNPA